MLIDLTSSGRRNSAFFYGVSPSNPLAIEAAARVRQSHVSSLAKSLARFPTPKQAQSAVNRSGAQCHAIEALQPAHRKNVLGLD
jgi:ABC-type thiamine transport system substrate-binding protein